MLERSADHPRALVVLDVSPDLANGLRVAVAVQVVVLDLCHNQVQLISR